MLDDETFGNFNTRVIHKKKRKKQTNLHPSATRPVFDACFHCLPGWKAKLIESCTATETEQIFWPQSDATAAVLDRHF